MEKREIIREVTRFAVDALIKFSNADIRVHDAENIPAQPSVFVVNHFTRMETFFLPLVLQKLTGKEILSLAHHSFFGGGFGRYLSKLGAVSTHDPQRDVKMITSLLRGDRHCMIFPEGQMIKDKKIVEKGKYMIYNTGMRRPPHTGAGILALQAEFYRLKIAYFLEQGNAEGLEEYSRLFDLGPREEIHNIVERETSIVPVNITYFPVRARNNIINKIAHLFVSRLSERVEEEIAVEGTMITDGVDIDINFGKPLSVRTYLSDRSMVKKIRTSRLYTGDEEMRKDLSFRRQGLDLMYRYMDSIYGMTTVNHDHVFAYILEKYRRSRIREDDFKNRAFLAIRGIRSVPMQSHHTTLVLKQSYLLTDDLHERYSNFIDAAKSDGLVFSEGGYLYKNKERFSRPHEFHTIRLDNIVEVLKNEIEPLDAVVRRLNRVMWWPSFLVRGMIRRLFLDIDRDVFERDYKKYFIEEESKPPNIGRPFYLRRCMSRRGILLVHGYMAAPEEVRRLGEFLHGLGYTVYGVRLRGHGTAPEDLAGRRWEEWYESVNRGYIVLKNSVRDMAVIGFSTGAGLALYQAIQKGGRFRGVISINAPLRVRNIASRLASTVVAWNGFMDWLRVKKGKMEFVTNRPENTHINYFRNPVKGVSQLEKFMDVVEGRLGELSVPALVIQGSRDPVVDPASGLEIFEKLGTRSKELCRVYAERHGIINGEGSDKIFRRIAQFLAEVMP